MKRFKYLYKDYNKVIPGGIVLDI